MGPEIAIVMATFNGEAFLADQLASIARQTYTPASLSAFDDGSSDGTIAVLEEFARSSPFPVSVIRRTTNVGASENFLAGARAVSEQFVAFADQDDVWHKRKLEVCATAIARHQVQLVMHSTRIVDERLHPSIRRLRYPPFYVQRVARSPFDLDMRYNVPGLVQVFDRHILEVVDATERPSSRHWSGQMGHDEFVYFVASALGSVCLLPHRLARRRMHSDNLSGRPASVAEIARAVIDSGAARHRARRDQAVEYAEFWDSQAVRTPALADDFRRAAAAWRLVATRDELRERVYASDRRAESVAAFAAGVRGGVYLRRCHLGTGPRGLIKDLAFGVGGGSRRGN